MVPAQITEVVIAIAESSHQPPVGVFTLNGHTHANGRPKSRRNPDPGLYDDEIRVLALLATGATQGTAARQLGISPRTLRRRLQMLCDRLCVATVTEAIVWAVKRGLI